MKQFVRNDSAFEHAGDALFVPRTPVEHRNEEYDEAGLDRLREMQSRHFWYIGRNRFLAAAVRRVLRRLPESAETGLSAIDLGGGCGGWVAHVADRHPELFQEIALADSSLRALDFAQGVVPPGTRRYQVDLLNLPWEDRWDFAFLLDVLEHLPQHEEAMAQIFASLKPGGHLIVTTPALMRFWSYNDEMARHVRRYSRHDYQQLADKTGFSLSWSRYFMFLLSPLLYATRRRFRPAGEMTDEQVRDHLAHTHRVPATPVNQILSGIFACETPVGLSVPFPWGTSLLGVFRKPE